MQRFRRFIEKKFRDLALNRKIMVIYFTVSFIPILILGAAMVSQERKSLRDSSEETVNAAVFQAASHIESDVRVYDNLSDYIAYNQPVSDVLTGGYSSQYEIYEQLEKTVDPILTSPTYFSPDIDKLTIYVSDDIAPHGRAVAPISEISGEDWYEDHRSEFGASTMWLIDKATKKIRSIRTMPLMQQHGVYGIMYLEIDYDEFFSAIKDAMQKSQGAYVTDRSGTIVYGRKYRHVDKSLITAQQKISGTGLTIHMYQSDGFSFAQHRSILIILAIYIAIVIFTLYVASKLFNRYVVRDIKALGDNMASFGKGDRRLTVVSDSKDEVGQLIRGFGNMVVEENQLIQENYENKLALRKAEMKALQAQINPHFLYNSLSLINWKAIEAGADDISDITLALSNFYRTSLNRGKNVLTIEKEIENVKSYIAIQSYMHDNSFDTVIDVDEDILKYETLNLLLQPLVENAIDHGIDLKEDGRGFIKIIGRQSADAITLTVEDNGVGMDDETAQNIITFKSKGYGVANVNQRIRLFYGKPYGLTIHSVIGRGTTCTVTIPKKLNNS